MFWSVGEAAIAAAMTPAVSFGPFSGQISTSWARPQVVAPEELTLLAMLSILYLDLAA